jgi:endonuclease V-like protein UPF0215 family
MLQGIALGGFNVVDVPRLHAALGLPVLVVARRRPDLGAIRDALLRRIPGGERKWRLIEALGAMESVEGIFVQRAGISLADAAAVIRRTAVNGRIPGSRADAVTCRDRLAGRLRDGQHDQRRRDLFRAANGRSHGRG